MADYDYTGSYTVSTGTDIYVVFAEKVITTAQGVSYSVTRQKAPVYTMGNSDPRAIARSKRGIAGSMILTTFNKHCLSDFIGSRNFYAKKDELAATNVNPYNAAGNVSITQTEAGLQNAFETIGGGAAPGQTAVSGANIRANQNAAAEISTATHPLYADQLLPFDVTLAAMNEYGNGTAMRIYAAEILNEGSGVSIDDTSNEVQLTYIARMLTPWVTNDTVTPITNPVS